MTTYTKARPVPRAICIRCNNYVWSDQARLEKRVGDFEHLCCPHMRGGNITEQHTLAKKLMSRAVRYEVQARRELYGSLPSIPE